MPSDSNTCPKIAPKFADANLESANDKTDRLLINSDDNRTSLAQKRKINEVDPEAVSNKRFRNMVTEKFKLLMECPVCLEVPKSGPVFSCNNGHLLCGTCQPKLSSCPLCRSSVINCRNILAEQFGLVLLDEVRMSCVNNHLGCPYQDLAKNMSKHQEMCLYEVVSCPSSSRSNCKWQGPLTRVLAHASQNACAQFVSSKDEGPFKSTMGDFADGNSTVFTREIITNWKPVVLLSKQLLRYFLYLTTHRDEKGNWYMSVRSLAHESKAKNIRVKITVTPKDDSSDISFVYQGRVLSGNLGEAQVLQSGCSLYLSDSHVKAMKKDKILFEYTIEVTQVV